MLKGRPRWGLKEIFCIYPQPAILAGFLFSVIIYLLFFILISNNRNHKKEIIKKKSKSRYQYIDS